MATSKKEELFSEMSKEEAMRLISILVKEEQKLKVVQDELNKALEKFVVYDITIYSSRFNDGLIHTYSDKATAEKMMDRLKEVNILAELSVERYSDIFDMYDGDHKFYVDDLDDHESLVHIIEKGQKEKEKQLKKIQKRSYDQINNKK